MFKTEFEPNFDALTVELDKPSLKALSHILRHRELWPTGFEWNFSHCPTCAIGMARELWFSDRALWEAEDEFHVRCGYSDLAHTEMFVVGAFGPVSVSPEMVADRIDAFLALRIAP